VKALPRNAYRQVKTIRAGLYDRRARRITDVDFHGREAAKRAARTEAADVGHASGRSRGVGSITCIM